MSEQDITNYLTFECDTVQCLDEAVEAFETLGADTYQDFKKIKAASFYFLIDWEPPFKELKQFSKKHPKVKLTLWGDAFSKHHWISKAIIEGGKSDNTVVSMVDDDFEPIFKEVYGCSFDTWNESRVEPFAQLV